MSFALTMEQFRNRTKTVTRRFGWHFLQPLDVLCGVEKVMGFKKGEKIKRLGHIRILSVRNERLADITQQDCVKEGFPKLTPPEFIKFFCKSMKCSPDDSVKRIEFEHLN